MSHSLTRLNIHSQMYGLAQSLAKDGKTREANVVIDRLNQLVTDFNLWIDVPAGSLGYYGKFAVDPSMEARTPDGTLQAVIKK